MSADTRQGAGTGSPVPRGNAVERVWQLLVEGLAAAGTVMIGILMFIICADIVARNTMGSSLPLVSELGALLLVMIVALQLAATIRANRLARTEVFIIAMEDNYPRVAALFATMFNLAGAGLLGGIAWATIRILEKDFKSAEFIGVVGIATMPTWPFRALILFGFAVASMEFLVRAVRGARVALGPAR